MGSVECFDELPGVGTYSALGNSKPDIDLAQLVTLFYTLLLLDLSPTSLTKESITKTPLVYSWKNNRLQRKRSFKAVGKIGR